jgi:hypothetical protein
MKIYMVAVLAFVLGAAATLLFFHFQIHFPRTRGPLLHTHNEFSFRVHAPYKVVAPLFGAEAERAWAGSEWDPQFLYPEHAQDVLGAVFLAGGANHRSVWVNTAFDLGSGHVQYAHFLKDAMVTLIDIHISAPDPSTTDVHVTYERTALSPAANDRVAHFTAGDSRAGKEWSDAFADWAARLPANP